MSAAARLIDRLQGPETPRVEVYAKSGKSRSAHLELGEVSSLVRQEQGWAVRAGGDQGSFFACGSGGLPEPESGWEPDEWPPARGRSLRLPAIATSPARRPLGIEAPLLGEGEAIAILHAVRDELSRELVEARLLSADLDDGFAEVTIESTAGVSVGQRARVAAIRLRARLGDAEAQVVAADRHARRLPAKSLARRLADRLTIAVSGELAKSSSCPVLLAPEVGSAVLEALDPLWLGAAAWPRLGRWFDGSRKRANARLTVIDDGAHAGGLFEGSVDGEGVPTRRILVVERGVARQPVLAWFEADHGTPSGCSLRPSWRQPPIPGATHLFIEPDASQSVAALLAEIRRGFFFIHPLGAPRVDLEHDRLSILMCGFAVERGRPSRPIRQALMVGSVSGFLSGIEAVARDLRFRATRGCYGAPSLLVNGLAIEPGP